MSSISIVTCWLGHPELAEDYIMALGPELASGDEVIIVDNGEAPELPWAGNEAGENLGFARGSNFGLELAQTEAVLFLNNDIALLRSGWLEELRQALERGALCGPLRADFHAHVGGQPLPYVDGWFLAGMREELLELGGFDDELEEPAYYSDNLLCLEARAAGMRLRELRPGLRHKLNATAGPARSQSVQAASAANRARYMARASELLEGAIS